MITGELIANNICAERNRARLSQEEVSEKIGVSKKTYIDYEKNANLMKIETLIRLAEVLGCNINDFYLLK